MTDTEMADAGPETLELSAPKSKISVDAVLYFMRPTFRSSA
jgi:hypothetical protein